MQTNISQEVLESELGSEANRILRSCVHCGFCTATCPTYQILGDELDGPRGRIYLIKDMLEGGEVTQTTQQHLDRCLSCRACETTCPSGVEYAHLADIGRTLVAQKVKRPLGQRLLRTVLLKVLPNRTRFGFLMRVGGMLRPVLPQKLKAKIPVRPMKMMPVFPQAEHGRKVLLIEGCVQPSLSPEIDVATAQVLDKLGVQTLRTGQVQCCGAVENHLQAKDAGLNRVRANIDAWLPYLDEVEAILSTASACALEIKEYGYMLRNDTAYAEKAAFVSSMTKDLVEVLMHENLDAFRVQGHKRISFHAPCTLQHGQKLNGSVEAVLGRVGFELETVQDSHLCCGSAGTYSILEPELSLTLRDNKVAHLNASSPELIATANIGCLHHMQAGTATPVKHWVTLLADLENDTKVQNV